MEGTYQKVKDNPTYAKNVSTGGVINTDETMYLARKRQLVAEKRYREQVDNRFKNVEDKISELSHKIDKLVVMISENLLQQE